MKCKYGHTVPAKLQHDYPDCLVETCIECGTKLLYNKRKDGGIDNSKYYKDHLKDFAQPYGKTAHIYEMFYGKKKLENPQDTELFYKEREAKRIEAWERNMKAVGEEWWAKKMKKIINQNYETSV